jgi:hypothetical protein
MRGNSKTSRTSWHALYGDNDSIQIRLSHFLTPDSGLKPPAPVCPISPTAASRGMAPGDIKMPCGQPQKCGPPPERPLAVPTRASASTEILAAILSWISMRDQSARVYLYPFPFSKEPVFYIRATLPHTVERPVLPHCGGLLPREAGITTGLPQEAAFPLPPRQVWRILAPPIPATHRPSCTSLRDEAPPVSTTTPCLPG